MRLIRLAILFAAVSCLVACTATRMAVVSAQDNNKTLYVLPDGTMEFKGRVVPNDDVIIYNDGRGGERAAVKLDLPLYSHAYRDSITVERITLDMPVARQGREQADTTF